MLFVLQSVIHYKVPSGFNFHPDVKQFVIFIWQ